MALPSGFYVFNNGINDWAPAQGDKLNVSGGYAPHVLLNGLTPDNKWNPFKLNVDQSLMTGPIARYPAVRNSTAIVGPGATTAFVASIVGTGYTRIVGEVISDVAGLQLWVQEDYDGTWASGKVAQTNWLDVAGQPFPFLTYTAEMPGGTPVARSVCEFAVELTGTYVRLILKNPTGLTPVVGVINSYFTAASR